MKKLFTLFMATVVAVSISAMPQSKLAQKKQDQTNSELIAKTPEQKKALDLAKKDLTKRIAKPVEKNATEFTAKHTLKSIKRVAAETYLIEADCFSVEPTYYAASNDWYCGVVADGYDFRFDWYAPENNYCGTFTKDQIELSYSYGIDPYDSYIDFEDITLVISKEKVSTYLTKVLFEANILGSDGNTYVVKVTHSIFYPKSTVESVITNATLTATEENFVLAGKNDQLDINLTVSTDWPTGRFTKGDFDLEATKIVYNGVNQTILQAELTVKVAALADGSIAYIPQLSYYNQDTVFVTVDMTVPMPTPADTLKLSFKNLSVDDSWAPYYGTVTLYASNSEWDVYLGYAALEAVPGVYESAACYVTNIATYDEVQSIYAKLTLDEDPELGWLANVEMYGADGKWYSLDMKFEVPVPTDTVVVKFENSAAAAFYPTLGNDLMLENEDEKMYAAIDIFDVPMGGTFTMDNVDTYYSYMYDIENSAEIQVADISGKVYQVGDTTIIEANVISFDAILYQVELWYAVPTPTDTVVLEMEAEFGNYIETNGFYTLAALSEDTLYYVSFTPFTSQVEGTYGNDGVFARFGAEGGYHDFYLNETYILRVEDLENEIYDQYTIEKGTMVVTLEENGTIKAVVDVICNNAVCYQITMTAEYNTHMNYDSPDPIERNYNANDVVTIQDYTEDAGYIYFEVDAADGSDLMAMYFFAEEADKDIIIPVGTYTIDASEEYNTVLASVGVVDGSVYPSFYAQVTTDGYIAVPLWFFVGGTVEVSKTENNKLYVEINAINSYDQPIKIVYDGTGTGVENIEVENITGVKKMMVDGQLVIIRNGEAFNATGARVK